jgi:hypothetical protein
MLFAIPIIPNGASCATLPKFINACPAWLLAFGTFLSPSAALEADEFILPNAPSKPEILVLSSCVCSFFN